MQIPLFEPIGAPRGMMQAAPAFARSVSYTHLDVYKRQRQVYEKIANIGKQTLHKESEEFNMKKKVLSVILAVVCTCLLYTSYIWEK